MLPAVVEAFFYTSRATDAQRDRAIAVRRSFLDAYGFPDEYDMVPMLRFDVSADSEPFGGTFHPK
eukprot:3540050-Prymnesium_polylepis.3